MNINLPNVDRTQQLDVVRRAVAVAGRWQKEDIDDVLVALAQTDWDAFLGRAHEERTAAAARFHVYLYSMRCCSSIRPRGLYACAGSRIGRSASMHAISSAMTALRPLACVNISVSKPSASVPKQRDVRRR